MTREESNIPDEFFMFSDGWRLTTLGCLSLATVTKPYEFQANDLSNEDLIALTECINVPYYLTRGRGKIIIFSDEESVLIKLTGDLHKWLEIKKYDYKNKSSET